MLEDKKVIVDDVRCVRRASVPLDAHSVRGVGKTFDTLGKSVFAEADELQFETVDAKSKGDGTTSVYFDKDGRVDTPIYLADELSTGDEVIGPAIIVDGTATIVVDPEASAKVTSKHLLITLK